MESNRDEAERCISIALNAIKSQKADKALRFLEKAERLFPTAKARGKDGEQRSGSAGVGGGRLALGQLWRHISCRACVQEARGEENCGRCSIVCVQNERYHW